MSESLPNRPLSCVVFALGRETLGLRRRARLGPRIASAPCPAWTCLDRPLLVVEAGVGTQSIDALFPWLASQKPTQVIMAGFAGALHARHPVGRVLSIREFINSQGESIPSSIGEANAPLTRLLTMDRMVGNPQEKQALGERHQADAVDMETYRLAELCRSAGIPFGALRVISDDANTVLSKELMELFEGGRVSMRGVIRTIWRRPSVIREMLRLARDTKLTSEALGEAVHLRFPPVL